ncbi:MAG: DSD1 family PLP-dependent enzyme [Rhodospirillales bacterium]|nr:DSD1 family PLP-dependent enzyme [Rhodospirillales bacterium]MDE0711204.1 DSD1 family PLP-dependent enzyme [Rhodospirillales bacterium]
MTTPPPAQAGMPLADVDTPALLIEMDAFERNLDTMAHGIAAAGVRLRPHAKTHKCAPIVRRQMALGAVGACCQKVSEAEALVQAGVPDVLVSNQVVGGRKIARLTSMASDAKVGVCVDNAHNVAEIGAAAVGAGVSIDVLVEIDVGMSRCGVAAGDEALVLARQVAATDGLRFAGLQAYHGLAQHIRSHAERRAATDAAIDLTRSTVDLLGRQGIPCEIVAGAGTGTWEFEAASGVYNELQAGSYVFMDADYAQNLDATGAPVASFEQALFIYSTVISSPVPERAVVDAGLKALSAESGAPEVADIESARVAGVSDEHTTIDLSNSNTRLAVGDGVKLIPSHCDPTANLHDWYVCVRNDHVEALWPVVARGCIW